MNLSSLNTVVSRKVVLFSDISAVNLIVGWNLLVRSIKRSTFFYVAIPKGENVINVAFPFSWLGIALLDYFRFNFRRENICERHCHFSSHSNSTFLEKALPIELKQIFVKD